MPPLTISNGSDERAEKEMKRSLALYAKLHKDAQVLMHKGPLPPI
jgi:hypothetical protein